MSHFTIVYKDAKLTLNLSIFYSQCRFDYQPLPASTLKVLSGRGPDSRERRKSCLATMKLVYHFFFNRVPKIIVFIDLSSAEHMLLPIRTKAIVHVTTLLVQRLFTTKFGKYSILWNIIRQIYIATRAKKLTFHLNH